MANLETLQAPLIELAPAKINLTLLVHGRRPDGYHELESLVVFAGPEACDRLTLLPGRSFDLEITGPGASLLASEDVSINLVSRAVAAALRVAPDLSTGCFRLEKRLPVAAGIGGGSADAAAALRLLQRANPSDASIDWTTIAASIGADVPVCLEGRASVMRGLGEQVAPVPALPPVWAVLVNPGVALATADVFRALDAESLPADWSDDGLTPALALGDQDALLRHVAAGRNDLEAAAKQLCPPIADVISLLAGLEGARVARMSGSGPTCFALLESAEAAEAGRRHLALARPDWWVAATKPG